MEPSALTIKDSSANPAPLGLFGFGMTTVLLNLHNAGIYEMNSMILAMGLCYGGLAQIIAVLHGIKKEQYIRHDGFYLLRILLDIFCCADNHAQNGGWVDAASSSKSVIAYLIMWGIFTLYAFLRHVKDQ